MMGELATALSSDQGTQPPTARLFGPCEPVWQVKFPDNRERAGNFSSFARKLASLSPKRPSGTRINAGIPSALEQGFLLASAGKLCAQAGKFVSHRRQMSSTHAYLQDGGGERLQCELFSQIAEPLPCYHFEIEKVTRCPGGS